MIQFNPVVVLHPNTEIIYPSLDVQAEGCVAVLHGHAPTSPGQAAQFGFESMDSFLSDGQFHPWEREPKKGTVLSTEDFAFVPVDLNLECSLKETADTCYHTMSGTFRLYQDDQASNAEDLPLYVLSEPGVNLSAHRAPIIQPLV